MNYQSIFWLLASFLLLSGCGGGSSGNTGQPVQRVETLLHAGDNREYILYIPAAYDGSTEVPLLLNFHGFSMTKEAQMAESDMRALAEANNFILVYPEGKPLILGALPRWNANQSSEDLGFVESLISKLSLEHKIDTKRVYAVGYSNGAMLSYALACYNDNLIAAVAAMSGTQLNVSSGCAPSHPTSVISIHSTTDNILPYAGNTLYHPVPTVLNFWRNHNNTNANPAFNTFTNNSVPIEHTLYTGGTNGTAVAHYKVFGAGHGWLNINDQGANTNTLIWNFVSKYDLDGLR